MKELLHFLPSSRPSGDEHHVGEQSILKRMYTPTLLIDVFD
jgi:hypothetical protein